MEVMEKLRGYQSSAILAARQAIAAKERPVLCAPCGAGKTVIASAIFNLARARGRKVVFTVPWLSLINQTYQAFTDNGMDEREIGIIQGNHELTDWNRPIQIASVDTLARRPKLPEADVVMFDEAHRKSAVYERWIKAQPNAAFIAVTATPRAPHLAKLFNRLIVVETTQGLIDQGFLVPPRIYAPASPDLSGVKVIAGDYHEGQLSEAMNKGELTADIVRTWLQHGEARATFAFCVDRAHARSVQQQFEAAGVPAGYVDCYTDAEERAALFEQLKGGEISVITSVGTLTTGVDCPWLSCIILARPTRSLSLFCQMMGRGLRTYEDKQDVKILDHSDSTLRLGLPQSIEWHSLGSDKETATSVGKSEEREPILPKMPKKCPKCSYLKAPGIHECPACGFTPERRSDIKPCEGELIEFDGAKKRIKGTREDKQATYSGLLWLAQERGKSMAWVNANYRAKFEVWPRGLHEVPQYPSQSLQNWVRSRQIAWAKGRSRQNASKNSGSVLV